MEKSSSNDRLSDSVTKSPTLPNTLVLQTEASASGLTYTAAGGQEIPNEGAMQPCYYTINGEYCSKAFQVAEINNTLAAVSRIVGGGNRVVFDSPEIGSFIEYKSSGSRIYLRQSNGVYYMDVWVNDNPSDFRRQGR